MKYKLAVFDLDGTILDTLGDLEISLNFSLGSCGFPARTTPEIRRFLGNGLVNLVDRSVPELTSEKEKKAVIRQFNAYYAAHCTDHTKPYEGILQMLKYVRKAGLKTAVVSNKPDYAVQTAKKTFRVFLTM